MPPRLDAQLVADVLIGMPGWTGDSARIRRTVQVPADRVEKLLAEVAATADAMNHHPVVEREGDKVTFLVWTHSEGGVTELDLTLAARIDDLVDSALGTN
jgi:4a-hydroxytetrahydrobiopterin dehydratase